VAKEVELKMFLVYPPALFSTVQIDQNAKLLQPLQCKKALEPKIESFRVLLIGF
jgi:hypothetical protein